MARLTDVKIIKVAYWKRLQIFQLILNFIEEAVAIVGASTQIDTIVENYTQMMKVSQKALNHLQGASEKAGEPSRLKRPKTVEIPKFDVNKPGMQTFLNSMELLSKSYKFDTDKDLAQFYLNNLTEGSKTTIFTIYPLTK
jgi:predicted GTPase